jgi:DNA (cytosine-5)-methyltransferase 1
MFLNVLVSVMSLTKRRFVIIMLNHKSIGGQKWAYYNEIDPYAAEWLRSLIRSGHIADGIVDERSISDVRPDELQEFTQCHFFAGIGVWSYALRSAGWEDDRPVWTGSCPCQPFSGAGNRKGVADKRHLWPHWFHLIEQCRPSTVFGEQVASKDGLGWIDLVQADMEGADYAIGSFDLCSAGFGAPHIRQRLWFVADTDDTRRQGWISGRSDTERQDQHGHVGRDSTVVGMGNADDSGSQGSGETGVGQGMEQSGSQSTGTGTDRRVDDTISDGRNARGIGDHGRNVGEQSNPVVEDGRVGNAQHDGQSTITEPRGDDQDASDDAKEQIVSVQSEGASVARDDRSGDGGEGGGDARTQAHETNGFWSDADWLLCRDGKWRPVRPQSFPLVNGATARVGRLRAYGNAITAQVAQGLIESYMEVRDDS